MIMAEANKYEQEAKQLVEGLEGTKWAEHAKPGERLEALPKDPIRRIEDYTRDNPMRALFITASVFFIYGSLRAILRR